MCEPTTIAMGLMAVSGAFAAKSAHDQGKYQQKVMENNAKSAEYAAQDALARGAVEEDQARQRMRAMIGQQKAALAANGIDTTTGTGSLLLTDTAGLGEFDALTVRNNAMKQAYGMNVQADNLMAEGAAARVGGRNQAIGSLLTTGSQAMSMYASSAKTSSKPYDYTGDSSGAKFSATGADVRARR